jgi:hypothetical protein
MKLTNKVSKLNIQIKKPATKPVATPRKRTIDESSSGSESSSESDQQSDQQSESETSSVEKLSSKLKSLKVKTSQPDQKKVKINPFVGGLSNKSYIKKPEDDSLDITEIFKNKQNIQTILKLLNDYKVGTANPIKCIILRGNIGSGKMTLLKACLKKAGYSNLLYDCDSDTEDIFDNLLINIEAKGFHKLMQQKGANKRAVLIRDIDGSLKPNQKTEFFKFINKSKNTIPILTTSTDRSVGTAREVPKCILQLEFEDPSTAELVRHFTSDKISKSALEKIITDSKFDLRYINNTINGLETSKSKVTIKKVPNFAKDIELDTFSCIKFCADPSNSWEEKLIHSSLYTNSTVFHNYPTLIKQISGTPDDMKLCSKIADICCESEIVINYSFENQYWDILDECYNSLGTIGPLELMTRNKIKFDKLAYPSSNLTVYKEEDLEFDILEKESMTIKIVLARYFNGNKFVGDLIEFQKDMKSFRYPVQAYKLANILTETKKVNTFLREFKKRLVKDEDD